MRQSTTGIAIASMLLLSLVIGSANATPLEITVSQRRSVRDYTNQSVTSEQLLTLLWAGYGYSGDNRVIPRIGDAHSLTLFSINSSGSYLYHPETNLISVWNSTVTKEFVRPHLSQPWQPDSDVVVIIVWNQTRMNNQYFAYTEAGCFVQNFYLEAVNLGIGTTCAQNSDIMGFQSDLGLEPTQIPLFIMPTGIPTEEYPNSTPDYTRMVGNLPPVQNSERSFQDALSNMNYARTWSTEILSLQETSQLLWAGYGYSSTSHRTTPSWGAWYPLILYMANATSTYRYWPENHSLSEIQTGDKRAAIASACDNQIWAADAPAIFLVTYNSTVNDVYPEPGWYDRSVETDAGCVVQQILLESSALSLSANIVASGFESWNGTSAQIIRNNLNIASSIVPLYILPVGHIPLSATPSPSATSSASPTPSASPTSSASPTPSSLPSPTLSPTSTLTPSPSPSPTFSVETVLLFAVPSIVLLVVVSFLIVKKRTKTKAKHS